MRTGIVSSWFGVAGLLVSAGGCQSTSGSYSQYYVQMGKVEAMSKPAIEAWNKVIAARMRGEKQDADYVVDVANANLTVQGALTSLTMDASQGRSRPSESTLKSIEVAEAAMAVLVGRAAGDGVGSTRNP